MAIWQTAGKVRMTPKGVYNSSTAYEILDIVSNADQTISYIAKQAVPAGTALTNTTYWTVIADVTEALENADAAISYIGDSYSSSSTYAVGDYVIHDGGLYRCKTAISTAEAWTAAHWQQVSVTDEFFNFSDDVVKVSNTQPTSVFNRMWIDSETESEEVPTYEEFQELESDVSELKSAVESLDPGLSNDAKIALLACFQHVAWIDEHGQTYYDALESALYADQYPKITAAFDPGVNTIYADEGLNALKQYLTVTYYETAQSSGTTVASIDYTLTGTLQGGTNVIMAHYDGLSAAFSVTAVDFYNKWRWTLTDGDLSVNPRTTGIDNTNHRLFISIANQNNRRFAAVDRGIVPFYDSTTSAPSTFYPIPVPAAANKVTVTVTPSTIQGQACIVKRTGTSYASHRWMEWSDFPLVNSFTASEDLELMLMMRVNSSNSDFSSATEPTQLVVEFE